MAERKQHESSALSANRMISVAEGNVRKVVGVLVEVLLIAWVCVSGLSTVPAGLYTALSAAAITVYRMGVESQ